MGIIRSAASVAMILACLLVNACSFNDGEKQLEEPVVVLLKNEGSGSRKDISYYMSQSPSIEKGLAPMGRALMLGNWPHATALAKAHLRNRPYDEDAFMVLATSAVAAGKYDLATFYARSVQKKNPHHPRALNILGLQRLATADMMQDYRRAKEYFQQAFIMSKDEVAAGLNLAHLYLELGNAQQAYATFAAVAKRCGQCSEALTGSAIAVSRLDRGAEVKDLLERVLAKEPDHPTALYQMALYYRNGKKDPAKATYYLQKIISNPKPQSLELKERARLLLYSPSNQDTL